ncbi:CbiX/SirB N-terminal domain-containing protein [Methylopila musalis]|uniref:CbiX/SirB N-terminal domain-containing protein n=1 Tax=Methylopila musalis TaxID=1134781 RepID=A0ABW3ZB71_9HYPH
MTSTAAVLYGRAAFDRRQSLAAVRDALLAQGVAPRIEIAFADLSGPSLPEVLSRLADEGVARVTVAPCMIPADPSLTVWLPGALSAWASGLASAPEVRLAPAIEAFADLPALARAALSAPADDVAEVAPSLGKPGWSAIPEHGRQAFFCVGARCLHRGAEPLYQLLRDVLKRERALAKGPTRVLCARTSCQFPCNRGPLMTVHPDGVWYGDLDPQAIDRIVREHFVEGRIVTAHVIARDPD